jgi:hypothetical protein
MPYQKSPEPEYVVVYNFIGNPKKAGVGHIAFWDGEYYYTYGAGDETTAIATATKLPQQSKIPNDYQTGNKKADEAAELEKNTYGYGDFIKIILPITPKFKELRKQAQTKTLQLKDDQILVTTENTEWQATKYKLLKHNCADLVNLLLQETGYLKKNNYSLTPSGIASDAAAAGLELIKTSIKNNQQLEHSPSKIQTIKKFLNDFYNEINNEKYTNLGILGHGTPSGIKTLRKIAQNPNLDDVKKFYQIQYELANKHYSKSTRLRGHAFRSEIMHDFYRDWFAKTILPTHFPLNLATPEEKKETTHQLLASLKKTENTSAPSLFQKPNKLINFIKTETLNEIQTALKDQFWKLQKIEKEESISYQVTLIKNDLHLNFMIHPNQLTTNDNNEQTITAMATAFKTMYPKNSATTPIVTTTKEYAPLWQKLLLESYPDLKIVNNLNQSLLLSSQPFTNINPS